MKALFIIGVLAGSAFAGAALAQTTEPSTQHTQTMKKATPTTGAATARTTQSLECSKEADAKGLHGAARKKFRSACKKEPKKS
jgi:hypothetical protein